MEEAAPASPPFLWRVLKCKTHTCSLQLRLSKKNSPETSFYIEVANYCRKDTVINVGANHSFFSDVSDVELLGKVTTL